MQIILLPPGATSGYQPLDVNGFRIWKAFVRKISSEIRLLGDAVNITLGQRNSILKIQFITHNQLSSPQFKEMWKYPWQKIGYVVCESPSFMHPVRFCFDQSCEQCATCNDTKFLRCSWCSLYYCIKHVLFDFHYCKTYVVKE